MKSIILFILIVFNTFCFGLFESQVDIFTGAFIEEEEDFSLPGPYGIKLHRSFAPIARSLEKIASGWHFNVPDLFEQDPDRQKISPEFQCEVLALHDEMMRLKELQFISKGEKKQIAKWHVSYDSSSCTIQSTLGDTLVYMLQQCDSNTSVLSEISKNGSFVCKYTYTAHPSERRLLIASKTAANGDRLEVEYFLEDPKSQSFGKVKKLSLFKCNQTLPMQSCMFAYSNGLTKVSYSSGVQKNFYFNLANELQTIEEWDNGNFLRKEQLFWNEGKLLNKIFYNNKNEAKQCLLFEYDSKGNLIKETLAGTLSGYDSCSLVLMDGKLSSHAECYSKYYLYNNQNILIAESEDNGSCQEYCYHENGKLSSIFYLEHEGIIARRFYLYDDNGCLKKEIYDNGSSCNCQDLANVVFREEKDFGPFHHLGLPCSILEKRLDPSTKTMMTIANREFAYSPNGLLLEEKVVDGMGNLLSTQNWLLDDHSKQLHGKEKDKEVCRRYDASDRLIYEWQSGNSFDMHYHYDLDKLCEAEKKYFDGRRESTFFYYDERGNLSSILDYLGHETKYIYDSQNRKVAEFSQAFDNEYYLTAFSYDSFHNRTQIVNAKGHALTTTFNSRGQPLAIEYPDGSQENFYYFLDGKLKEECKRDKQSIQYIYDSFGNISNKTVKDSNCNVMEIIDFGYIGTNLVYELSSLHGLKQYSYDIYGNITEIESDHCSKFTYDSWGNVLEKHEVWTKAPEISHIARLQEKAIYNHRGECCYAADFLQGEKPSKREIIVNPLGQKLLELHFTDEAGNQLIVQYNAYNLPVLETKKDPFGTELYQKNISYDELGNKVVEVFQSNCKTQMTKWIYGPLNRLEETIESFGTPHQKSHRYFYNHYGQLQTIEKPDGTLLCFEYDPCGRVSRHYSTDQTIDYSFTYDGKGNLIQAIDYILNKTAALSYNGTGKVVSEVLANGLCLQNEYDSAGRRTALYFPDGSAALYLYDTLFLKEIIRKDKKGDASYRYGFKKYDLLGRCLVAEMIGSLGEVHSSDDGNTLISPYHISLRAEDSVVLKHPKGIEEMHFTKDAAQQITAESGHFEQAYCYDSFGSRTANANFKYDLNGNLIENGQLEFAYDALNRLSTVSQNGILLVKYLYDCFHRRIAQISQGETHYFLYDGLNEIGRSTVDGTLLELRLIGENQRSGAGATVAIEINGEPFAPIHDVIGSIVGLINTKNRQIEELYYHSAFGEEKMLAGLAPKNPWRYCGKRVDADSGLIFFGRRYYAPKLGCWLTPDPAGYSDGPNLYLFAKNNPIQNRDAYGLFSFNSLLHVVLNPLEYIDDCMGKMFHYFCGYYIKECNSGVFGSGEISDKVRVTMINGMLTDEYWLLLSAKALSYTHGGVNIHYVHRPPTNFLLDAMRSYMIKNGCISPHARLLAQMWKELIQDMGGEKGGGSIIHYAHSIGTCETMAALSLLTEAEKKMIKVYSFGSPCLSNKRNYQIHHYVSVRDGVCLLDFPYLIKAAQGRNPYVTFVGTFMGCPFVDHLFGSESYTDIWSAMGKTFVEWYGSLL